MSSSPILDNLRNVSLEVPTQWTTTAQKSSARLDLGDEERKKKLVRAYSRIRSTYEVNEGGTW